MNSKQQVPYTIVPDTYNHRSNQHIKVLRRNAIVTVVHTFLFCCGVHLIDVNMSFSIPTAPLHPYAVNVELHLQPDRREEFLKIIKYDAQQTIRTEPGAIQFTIGMDTTDTDKFHLHEQYQTKDDFDHHCTTTHYQEWNDFCATKPFVSDPIVQFYQCCNERVTTTTTTTTTSNVVQPSEVYCLNVELCIREDVRDEFLRVIQNNQFGSRDKTKEPLCLQYDFGESTTIPNHFYFHEQYIGSDKGREGFIAHTKSDHFAKWEQFAASKTFTKEPVVSFFQSISY
jgi:quinol monooxygenase YgiN